jgi:hypothetical protein
VKRHKTPPDRTMELMIHNQRIMPGEGKAILRTEILPAIKAGQFLLSIQ